MNYTFGDTGTAKGRAQSIRGLFIGGTTINAHTEKCIKAKVWTESELLAKASVACRNEVRDALGALVDGLPFAGPTQPKGDSSKPLWKQMELWTKDDYYYNFNAYAQRGSQNIAVANKIAQACSQRYGEGPIELQIVEGETAAV